MTTTSSTTRGGARIRVIPSAGRIAASSAALSFLLLVLLHVLRPDLDPSWRFVSEYATGEHGWLMALGFLSLALGCAALFVAIRKQARGLLGIAGLILLALAVLGLGTAAFFPMDLITTDPTKPTQAGMMHAFASMVGVPSLPIAGLFLSLSLGRRPDWAPARTALLWASVFMLACLILMIGTVAVQLPQHGGFGPAVLVGWPNRLLMLAYCLWVGIAGSHAAKLARLSLSPRA